MRHWLLAHKPAASRRTHILLAAILWSAVGTLLLVLGIRWTLPARAAALLLPFAVLAGVLKARFVLDRVARRVIDRIRTRGDDRCLGGFLSPKTWALVAVMMIAGRLLRGSPLPRTIIGLLYITVGTALLLASRRQWRAWHEDRNPSTEGRGRGP
jgi:hypothetical protein